MAWPEFQALARRTARFTARQQLVVYSAVEKALAAQMNGNETIAAQIEELRGLAFPGAPGTDMPLIPNTFKGDDATP